MSLPEPITSRTNARVKALRASLSGKARLPGDVLGLEGWTLIREAHSAGSRFETVYVREGSEARLVEQWQDTLQTEDWAVLSPEVFDSAVATATPQGIAATWRIVEPPRQTGERAGYGLLIEDVQDPGNLGTLLRSALAFGIQDVVVTPRSVNQWNPKVVRAAASASFHVRVHRMPMVAAVAELRAQGARVFAAVSSFLSGPAYGTPVMAAPHGVLFGRRKYPDAQAPRYDAPGSLDQRERKAADGYPASLSYDADLLEPCAVMVGNEGAGLSEEARQLADEQIRIPCTVESLNAAVAGSVLLYEVMRQRTLRDWARQQELRP